MLFETTVSNNAAEGTGTIVQLVLAAFCALVLSEVGKRAAGAVWENAAASVKEFRRRLVDHSATLERPNAVIATSFVGCDIQCMFPRTSSERVKAKMLLTLKEAVTEATMAINALRICAKVKPVAALYEYNIDHQRWVPIHIQLTDGRFIDGASVTSLAEI